MPRVARTPLMQLLQRVARDAARREADPALPSRRTFLRRTAALAAATAWSPLSLAAREQRVVIVGAGLAGLTAAWTLAGAGVRATLIEGSPRLGGRCWTDRHAFADGQVAERGGELIDTTHERIRALCARLSLPLDDLVAAEPKGSAPAFFFDGAPYTLADVERDFRAVRPALAADAKVLGDDTTSPRIATTRRRSAGSTA